MTEEDTAEVTGPQKTKEVSFDEALLQFRKMIDAKFPKVSEDQAVQLTIACFNAQMTVLHARMIGHALGIPERQELLEALMEERKQRSTLHEQYQQLSKAYKNVQRMLNDR